MQALTIDIEKRRINAHACGYISKDKEVHDKNYRKQTWKKEKKVCQKPAFSCNG